jgi:hypothetical protein
MIALVLQSLVVGYLPGAAIFRLPVLDRERRAALEPAERVFWAVVISLALTLVGTMVLAALGQYSFQRLLVIDGGIAAIAALGARRSWRLTGAAPLAWWSAAPVALAAVSLWLYAPPAEYIVGGKDPGVYLNAGVQISQRGSLVIDDALVASLPVETRDLFFPQHRGAAYYSNRFMGFFLIDADRGTVVDQFPHLFPAAVAIGYDLVGLTGARYASVVCAVLGVLALYFLGARLIGRPAGAAAAALLAIHVVQLWHARIPNSEVLGQPLLLAGLLALARAHQDDDMFFAPVAGLLLGLLPFARFDGVLAVGLAGVGLGAFWLTGGRVLWAFMVPLGGALLAFGTYLLTWLAPYAALPRIWVEANRWTLLTLLGFSLAAWLVGTLARRSRVFTSRVRTLLPHLMAAGVIALAAYAAFFREPAGKLALHDAHSLRMFAWYVHPAAIAAALAGLAVVGTRVFWRDPAFFFVACGSAVFLFYRIRIVPEHFWATRRYMLVVLPAVLLMLAATLLVRLSNREPHSGRSMLAGRYALRLVVLGLVAWGVWQATSRVRPHVEYSGVIPRLEALAARFNDDDLVIVESRNASDLHVLALPLAYVYDKSVLVLSSPKPDKTAFEILLGWARGRYQNVYFIGGGGTDLLSREVAVEAVASDRFQFPEYESLRNGYPTRVRFKEFDFGLYRFVPPRESAGGVAIDVGEQDDLQVVRFHAKERDERGTYRWTRAQSYLSLLDVPADAQAIVLWMDNGGRPAAAGPADVELFIGDTSIGRAVVASGIAPYAFEIPATLAGALAASRDAVTVRIRTATWRPREVLKVGDDRELGVMVDRVEIRRGPPREG